MWIKQVKGKTETWVYNGTDWVKSEDKDLADFSAAVNEELTGIKGQLDGKAETWYQNTNPRDKETGKWESGGTDKSHEGDIWYDTTNGTTKFWTGSTWEKMDIPKDVFNTIDGKSSIFVDSYDEAKAGTGAINKGYKERDLWILPANATVNGTAYYKGDMLTATSNNKKFDETNWEKKVRYVGPTELNKAIDTVNNKINTITNTTIPGINNRFNDFVKDGVLDSSEKARLTDLLNQASNEVAAVVDQVTNITKSKYLAEDNANRGELIKANAAMNTAWKSYNTLIKKLVDANTKITKVNIGEANNYYNTLQTKIKEVKQYLAICQADILNSMGTDITSYKYLKDILNQNTEVTGGLILTNAILFKDVDKKVTAGMNGIVKGDKSSIAAWYGGPMVDRDTFTKEQLETKVAGTDYAMSLLRHDGTGYLAGGNIHWDAKGVLSGNFNSFILQTVNIAAMFFYIRLFYLHSPIQDTTKFENIDYVTPMKPFSRLSVQSLGGTEGGNSLPTGLFIGDSKTGGSFQVGNVIIRTNSKDPNILEIVSATNGKTAHLGVQGGVSAYGTYTPSTGGGGGLSGTIIPYSTAIASDPQNEGTKIASASSIYKLHSRISTIETNGATSIAITGTGNAITSVVKNGTSITFTKGSTFLTNHQSLANCVQTVTTTGTGNAVTAISKSGSTITVTKGATFLTSHQSLANYYTKSSVDSLLSGKSATSHTHSVKINGVTKTIAATGGAAVDLGTYLTSHQSLADYAKKSEIPTKVSQLSNDKGYLTSHQSLANYVTINDSRLSDSRYPKFANNTWYLVGDDAFIGDHNIGGQFCIMGNNGTTGLSFHKYGDASVSKSITFDGTTLRIDGNANYASSAGNADKLDGIHANGLLTAISNSDKGISITVGGTTKSVSNIQVYSATKLVTARNISIAGKDFVGNVNFDGTGNVSLNGAINYCTINIGNIDPNPFKRIAHIKVSNSWNDNALLLYISQGYNGGSFGLCRVEFRTNDIANSDTAGGGVSLRWLIRQGYAVDSIQAGYYIRLKNAYVDVFIKTTGAYQGTVIRVIQDSRGSINSNFGLINSTYNTEAYTSLSAAATALYNVAYQGTVSGVDVGTINYSNISGTCNGNAGSATKLANARTIWGQSFDGTGNVNGTIYINNNNSSNGAIRLNNDISSNARISAIDNQVIFNTGAAIRFGETAWDWNKWAGLKYTHSNKTIYLGIAENSAFIANSAQSDGTLRLAGITTITPDSGARIGGSGGALYLGNANNSNYVKVQDICSQIDSNNWRIQQGGYALFKDITIINTAAINGSTHINNLLTAKGIMPTTVDVNAFGTNVKNWEGSIAANVTNMFNSIPQENIQVEYSMDNGVTWNTYFGNPENRFNLVNDNPRVFNYYLGSNNLLGDTDADKLAQIKKNQLRVTVKIPAEIYQELSWISVDVNNGVDIKCQVYFGSSTGAYREYVSKIMNGWSHKCDICVGPLNVNVGNDTYRYVRLVFSHLNTHTNLRNGIVAKIRALALTKYNYGNDRYTISTTGHIYDYDAYMNTYFPNSILAKGGVTAYKSSDIRLKTNIVKLNCLKVIKSIGGTYEFDYIRDHKHSIGFIAQNVNNPLLNDIVAKDDNGYLKINYWNPKLISLAFGALTEIDDEVDKLKAKVRELENEVEYLKNKAYALQ